MDSSLWKDSPIAREEDDLLGRTNLSSRIAELLNQTHSREESVVHGIVGAWGSGKSSLINLVTARLKALESDWVIVHFTPWATGDMAGMLTEYSAALNSALPERKVPKAFKKSLRALLYLSAPVLNVLALGSLGTLTSDANKYLGKQKSWTQQFAQVSKDLKSLDLKILIVADDIDRLQSDELLNFLKLVRLVGRLPGVSYLLGYDENSLVSELTGSSNKSRDQARDFLEKFVQYPIHIPPLTEDQILELINKEFEQIEASTNHIFPNRKDSLTLDSWHKFLKTPRAIYRYSSQLKTFLGLHAPGEIDLADFAIITLLRLEHPKYYALLASSKNALTLYSDREKDVWTNLGVTKSKKGSKAKSVEEIIHKLFLDKANASDDTYSSARIHHNDYFDRYFFQGIPKNDVSDSDVKKAISSIQEGDSSHMELLFNGERGPSLYNIILRKISNFSGWRDIGTTAPLSAIKFLINKIDSFSGKSGTFLFSNRQTATSLISAMLLNMPKGTPANEILDLFEDIRNSKNFTQFLYEISDVAYKHPTEVLSKILEEISAPILDDFIHHVLEGNDADLKTPVNFQISTLTAFALERTRKRLKQEELMGLDFWDLVSRLVNLREENWPSGPSTIMTGINWTFFDELIKNNLIVPKISDLEEEINDRDVSWLNRKRFAKREIAKNYSAQ